MSGIVDKWTNELAKLREKGLTLFSNGSKPTATESNQVVPSQEKSSTDEVGGARGFVSRIMRVNSPGVICSEGSVSMLVEWFSP